MQKTFLGLGGAALVTILAMIFLGGPRQEFTTTSSKAYDLYVEGHSELRAFHYSTAESLLTASVALDSTFAMAHAVLATIYFRQDQRDLGIEMFERAEELAENIADATEQAKTRLYMAQYERRSSRQDSLLAFLEEREPENLLVLSVKASILFANNDPQTEAAYRHILEIDPNFATAYNMLGYSAARRGDYDRAVEYLRKYAFVAPDLANPHDSLGEILMMVGRYDEAAREFKQALKIQPDFHFSLINLGEAYMRQGKVAKGRKIFEKVREMLAGTGFVNDLENRMVRLYFELGYIADARNSMQMMVDANPDNNEINYMRALLAALSGDREKALQTMDGFMSTLNSNGDTLSAGYRYADLYTHQLNAVLSMIADDQEAAAHEWGMMVELNCETPAHETNWMRVLYGISLQKSGRPEEAREQGTIILAVNPNNINALLLLCRADLDLGRLGEAQAALDRLQLILSEADVDMPAVAEATILKRELASRI